MVRDFDLVGPHVDDALRLEVVADGLPLFGSASPTQDAGQCSANPRLSRTEWPPKQLANEKVTTYPGLVGPHRRVHLVVLALEVVGRWSRDTQAITARSETQSMGRRVEQAWRLQWGSMMGCGFFHVGAAGCAPPVATHLRHRM